MICGKQAIVLTATIIMLVHQGSPGWWQKHRLTARLLGRGTWDLNSGRLWIKNKWSKKEVVNNPSKATLKQHCQSSCLTYHHLLHLTGTTQKKAFYCFNLQSFTNFRRKSIQTLCFDTRPCELTFESQDIWKKYLINRYWYKVIFPPHPPPNFSRSSCLVLIERDELFLSLGWPNDL